MKTCWLLFFCILAILSCNNKKEDKKTGTVVENRPPVNSVKSGSEQLVNPYAIVDVSPMDMTYFPADYPKLKMTGEINTPPLARVIYSRPHLQGRHIFHEVLKYGEMWRLGANESTELELFVDAIIQGKKVNAGRYVLYCIPQEKEWTIVLNGHIDSWGLKQEPSKDITKFTVPVVKTNNSLEYYTMVFLGKDKQAELLMAWDNVEVKLPISF